MLHRLPGAGLSLECNQDLNLGHGQQVQVVQQVRDCLRGIWDTVKIEYEGTALVVGKDNNPQPRTINVLRDKSPCQEDKPADSEVPDCGYPLRYNHELHFVPTEFGHAIMRRAVQPLQPES